MKSAIDDSELIVRLKKGDAESFDLIYKKYSGKIYSFGLKYLRSSDEVEELVQSVFLKLWENHRNIDEKQSFKSFLFIIDWVKNQRESWHGVDYTYHGRQWKDEVINYCETLMSVDESIGSVLDFLKNAGIDENTMVIYMGDNGFAWGEHGLIDKRQFYEESVRVPMLARCPGLFQGGQVLEKMVQNIDIAPTILACAGLEKAENMVGSSFLPLLQGKEIPWRDCIFYEYFWEHEYPQTPTMFGIRTDRYKYIRYYGIWDTDEFYDLREDPYETKNLITEPELQDTIIKLNHKLYNWLESTNGMSIPLKRTERPHIDHRNRGFY